MEYHPVDLQIHANTVGSAEWCFFVEAAVTTGSCSASNLSNWNWNSQRETKT